MKLLTLIIAFLAGTTLMMSAQNRVLVSKKQQHLWVISQSNDTLLSVKVSTGKNPGNKQRRGDNRTPEGTFPITQIQDASAWTHDFKDGKGERKGAYGPFFCRLSTPGFSGIGIHGTCFPELLGTPSSEGCIRMHDDNLRKFVKLVKKGTKVTVTP
ncbi:MAG: L,D-transpeptidase [Muribaculaceae bacterium]|nr:L,D-transpeptidase [Muribaculaceae bacterium]